MLISDIRFLKAKLCAGLTNNIVRIKKIIRPKGLIIFQLNLKNWLVDLPQANLNLYN